MSRATIHALSVDALDGLDAVVEEAAACRAALLAPYGGFSDHRDAEGDGEDAAGRPLTIRVARTLGPPFELAARESGSALDGLAARLSRAAAPAVAVRRVERSSGRLSHLVYSYGKGLYESLAPSAWRAEVDRLHGDVLARADEARRQILEWETEATRAEGPDSSVLKDQEIVFAETIVRMLGGEVGLDAARKMIAGGGYGRPFSIGKRNAILKADFLAALAARAKERSSKKEKKASGARIENIPRRLRGRRGGARRRVADDTVGAAGPRATQ